MFMKQYLDIFWDHLDKAKDLFKALEFAAAIPSEDRTKDYLSNTNKRLQSQDSSQESSSQED